MASRLLPAFRRSIGVFSSNYQGNKLGGFPKYSRKSLRKGSASFFALAAAAAAGFLWLERYDETSITLSPQLHHLLMHFWQQGLDCNYQSAMQTDVSGSVNCFRTSNTDASDTSSLSSNHFQTESQNSVGASPKSDSTCLTRHSIADAAAKVAPAVVNLTVTQGLRGMFLGRSIGSGTIIDSNGTILTNAHVVAEFTSAGVPYKGKVVVTLQDGRTFDGEVINADFHTDIAVVRINTKVPLPAAKLGSSSKLRPGDWVIALGCPLSLQNTVTAGIVSYVDRKSSDLGLGGIRREYYYLQTDCAINEGSSGGPLVNLDGEVIGINTMKALAADGVSFAIPIDSVIKTVEHFKKHGRVVRPWLGLKMLELNELIIAQLKERDPSFPDVTEGVLVPQVTPGSPAHRSGFRPGDVVVQFDGKPTKSIKEIVEIMGDKVGVAFKVIVKRSNNVQETLTIVPEEASPNLF
uniref:PDZ domain-containing protein n=1 Tax=Picea sitchensis TaxID=3332 RepID=A9NVJ7_PICSI|nr:unknown [Picea sitchensis]